MTVHPLPDLEKQPEKPLIDQAVPTGGINYVPVAKFAASSARTQHRLRFFRRLMILLMVIGLLIISICLAYGLYRFVCFQRYNSHHHISSKDGNHGGPDAMHYKFAVNFDGKSAASDIPESTRHVSEKVIWNKKQNFIKAHTPEMIFKSQLFGEAGVLRSFTGQGQVIVIRGVNQQRCFIRVSNSIVPKDNLDYKFKTYENLLNANLFPDISVRLRSYTAQPMKQSNEELAEQYSPEVAAYCVNVPTFFLVVVNDGSESLPEAPKPQPQISCPMLKCSAPTNCVDEKYEQDANGCDTCKCLMNSDSAKFPVDSVDSLDSDIATDIPNLLDDTKSASKAIKNPVEDLVNDGYIKPMSCKSMDCKDQCLFGFKMDQDGCQTCECIIFDDTIKEIKKRSVKDNAEKNCENVYLDEGIFPSLGEDDQAVFNLQAIRVCEE